MRNAPLQDVFLPYLYNNNNNNNNKIGATTSQGVYTSTTTQQELVRTILGTIQVRKCCLLVLLCVLRVKF